MTDWPYYILVGRIVKKVGRDECYAWLETQGEEIRRVAASDIGQFWVSTVFETMDHGFSDAGLPVVFETMVFERGPDGTLDMTGIYTDRCSTYDDAEKMHAAACERVRSGVITGTV